MSESFKVEPPAHIKALIREWVDFNLKKYGPDWKKIVAAEMTKDLMKATQKK